MEEARFLGTWARVNPWAAFLLHAMLVPLLQYHILCKELSFRPERKEILQRPLEKSCLPTCCNKQSVNKRAWGREREPALLSAHMQHVPAKTDNLLIIILSHNNQWEKTKIFQFFLSFSGFFFCTFGLLVGTAAYVAPRYWLLTPYQPKLDALLDGTYYLQISLLLTTL